VDLRDQFALAALTGLLADRGDSVWLDAKARAGYVRMAYEVADAMLAARETTRPGYTQPCNQPGGYHAARPN
jgi:hypothetical protein